MFQFFVIVTILFCTSNGFKQSFVNRQKVLKLMSTSEDISSLESANVKTEAPKSILITKSLSNLNRIEVGEAIIKLEKENPTENSTSSPKLNGVWEVLSTGAVSSLGLLLFQVVKSLPGGVIDADDIVLTISQGVATAASKLNVGTAKFDVTVSSDLVVESPIRLKETYSSAKVGTVELPPRSGISRSLFVTYLDDDLLIVRDKFGSPDVLKRMEKQFQSSTDVTESQGSGEDGAPGV